MRNWILLPIVLFTISSYLCSHETIIDSISADPYLDGYIYFSQNFQEFYPNTTGSLLYVGDQGNLGIYPDPNSVYRSFISFDLPPVPEGYGLDNATLRLYQHAAYGNSVSGYPIWDVPGGDTIFCIMDHIDYGSYLSQSDWTAGDLGFPSTYHSNIGVISNDSIIGYHYLDVTYYVLTDYSNERTKTQYRIRFPIDTDWDDEGDMLVFSSANTLFENRSPTLFLTFSSNPISNNHITVINEISIFPNPFNPSTNVSFILCDDTHVLLTIYNIKGQRIKTLVDQYMMKGNHTSVWNGNDDTGQPVSTGIYFSKLRAGDFQKVRKMLLIK
ncbi:MAG: T9SS type A sorting domain-containing protein [Candidatus Cloacimonetes bacterium]|nr:T9SS type A sorting domain-containing protein [Candidatus Cloacimonadota bacterium]